jgi:2-methylcitrate dehydratase PrpD
MADHSIDPSLVEDVEVLVHSSAAGHPGWLLQDPPDYLGTQMSHPWCIAMTLLGIPVPRWQQPDTIADPRARDLASRVRVGIEPTAQRVYYDQLSTHVAGGPYGVRRVRRMPGTVIMRMKDGQEYRATSEYGAGDPFTPETRATDDQLREKFLSFGELAVPREKLERACDALFTLEGVDDVNSLVDLLCV